MVVMAGRAFGNRRHGEAHRLEQQLVPGAPPLDHPHAKSRRTDAETDPEDALPEALEAHLERRLLVPAREISSPMLPELGLGCPVDATTRPACRARSSSRERSSSLVRQAVRRRRRQSRILGAARCFHRSARRLVGGEIDGLDANAHRPPRNRRPRPPGRRLAPDRRRWRRRFDRRARTRAVGAVIAFSASSARPPHDSPARDETAAFTAHG